jgi:hypothetical protein
MAIQINLSDDFDEMFRDLIEKTPFESEAEVISNAIALLDLVCEAREFGFKLAMVDDKGNIEDYIQGF